MNEIQWQLPRIGWETIRQIQHLGGGGGDGGGDSGTGTTGDGSFGGGASTDAGTLGGGVGADALGGAPTSTGFDQGVTGDTAMGSPGGFNAGDAFGASTGPGAVASSTPDAGLASFDTGVSFGNPTSSAPDQGVTGTAATGGAGFGAGFGTQDSMDTGIGIGTDAFGQTTGPSATNAVASFGAPDSVAGFPSTGFTGDLAGNVGINDIGNTFGPSETATHGAFDPTAGVAPETAANPNFGFNFGNLGQPQAPSAPPFNTNASPVNLGQFNQAMSQLASLPQTFSPGVTPNFGFNNQGQLSQAELDELASSPQNPGFTTGQLAQMFGGGAMPTSQGPNLGEVGNVMGQSFADQNAGQQAFSGFPSFASAGGPTGGGPISVASNTAGPSFGGGQGPTEVTGGTPTAGPTAPSGGQTEVGDPAEGQGSSLGNGGGAGFGASLGNTGGGGGDETGVNPEGVHINPNAPSGGVPGVNSQGVAVNDLVRMLQGGGPSQNLASQNSQILAQLAASPQAGAPGLPGAPPQAASAQTASLGKA